MAVMTSRQRTGEQRSIQYIMESCSLQRAVSILSTVKPQRAASAANPSFVHHVKWCGGAFTRKFGIRVMARSIAAAEVEHTVARADVLCRDREFTALRAAFPHPVLKARL